MWGLVVNKRRFSHPLFCLPPERHVPDHTGFSRTGLQGWDLNCWGWEPRRGELWLWLGSRLADPRALSRESSDTVRAHRAAGAPEAQGHRSFQISKKGLVLLLWESLLCSWLLLFPTFPPIDGINEQQGEEKLDSSGYSFCPINNPRPILNLCFLL